MNELARYLVENAIIDFKGGITIEQVRAFLRTEDSRESRALLSKLIDDNGVDALMLTIADCLKDYIRSGVSMPSRSRVSSSCFRTTWQRARREARVGASGA